MFERGKKDDDTIESRDTNPTKSDLSYEPARPAAVSRGNAAVIGRSIQINGDLRGDEDLRIEGDVSGTVELRNNALTIGKEGKVKAGVYAKSIAVDGETNGDLYATERVSIHVNARVQGNIIAPRVSIEEGAHFKGSIEMDSAAIDRALGKTTAGKTEKPVTQAKPGNAASAKTSPKSASGDAGANVTAPAKTA